MGKWQKPLELKPLAIELELAYRIKAIHADILSGPIHMFDEWSIKRLTGSMCFLSLLLRHVRWMVDREACVGGSRSLLGPLRSVLGRSRGLCWRSGGARGTHVGDLEALWAILGRS